MKVCALLAVLYVSLANSAQGAEFMYIDGITDNNCPPGFGCARGAIVGEILAGDADRIIEKIKQFEGVLNSGGFYEEEIVLNLLALDSPGGDLLESIKIGRFFREKAIHTIVREEGICYSSCVMLYAAGITKYTAGQVGIHTFFSTERFDIGSFGEQNSSYNEIGAIVREYLIEMRVSPNLLDMMYRVPPDDIRILDVLELHDLGLLGEDPLFSTLRR